MPFIDPANPSPWLASLRASRRRRAEAARQARRRRAGRGGGAAVLAAMTLAAGGAVARRRSRRRPPAQTATASGVVALQRALGVSADGVIGPVTRRAIRNYQRNQGLAVDGIAGPATLASLGISASSAPAKTQTTGSTGSSGSGTLAKIAQCESGGDPTAISSSGRYRGKYQFSRADLARPRRHRRPGGRARVRPGRDGGEAARPARHAPWPVCGS